ncbi:MAG TPA: hypothetical protein VL485_02360 [Ktedonobacteraceae bacterium]|jgi:hypothetical protein|nr:hypothetical protein [Ktedonobacteraceae bacterium]
MQPEDFLKEARIYQPDLPPQSLLQLVAYEELSFLDTEEKGDQHAAFRMSVLTALHRKLSPEDRTLIRFLLAQEITYHERMWSFSESIKLCAFLLFLLAHVEDVSLLWEAKTTSFDTMCGLDIQLLLGAGASATLAYLQQTPEEWAQQAKEYIEECQNMEDCKLERYRIGMRAHFGMEESSHEPNA